MKTVKFKFRFLYNDPIKVSISIGFLEELKQKNMGWNIQHKGCCVNKLADNKLDIYIVKNDKVEFTLMHELTHATDLISDKIIRTDDIKVKSQIFRYLVEKSEKILDHPLELREGYIKSTDIFSIFLLDIPIRLEITSEITPENSIMFREDKWVCKKPNKEDGVVLRSMPNRGYLAEMISYFVYDVFSRKRIDDNETRAYSIGGLWKSLILDN